ncbi:hypothetical protein ACUN24_16350 [Pedobacter sp. WC2501]|uniref:hypothetical protein n=1 Tax=Pedobacter sp. WC2501 TaxID=3461400 RepID=UPI0040458A06
MRLKKGSQRFFYGSSKNKFWEKYSNSLDSTIIRSWDKEKILISLKERQIAISDTIVSCDRFIVKKGIKNGFSSDDSALHNIVYNEDAIINLIKHGVIKVMCKSKGVLNALHKILIRHGGKVDSILSANFQDSFLKGINGDSTQLSKPITISFKIADKTITALAIPSPGSFQRQLKHFGFNNGRAKNYADQYFNSAFSWLNE